MYISASTLDDLMHKVLTELLDLPPNISATRGTSSEIVGVLLELKNPRSRLSRTETKGMLFSALGELFWYLSKSNNLSFISYYIHQYENETEDGETVYGGYGPRLFNLRGHYNQVLNVIKLLKKRPTSRKAVIQLFDGRDLNGDHIEIPCTCTLQFMIRNEKLHMITSMRSNDAYLGLPHDIFAFTMLQEIIAVDLNVEVGKYSHFVGSLHLYDTKREFAKQYLQEGFQSTDMNMPSMPPGDPWKAINTILKAESRIRMGEELNILDLNLNAYWLDLVKLFQIYYYSKKKYNHLAVNIQRSMSSHIFDVYIDKRLS